MNQLLVTCTISIATFGLAIVTLIARVSQAAQKIVDSVDALKVAFESDKSALATHAEVDGKLFDGLQAEMKAHADRLARIETRVDSLSRQQFPR